MLDDEPSSTSTDSSTTDSSTADSGTTAQRPVRRRRAASRPAGPPAVEGASEPATGDSAGEPGAERTTEPTAAEAAPEKPKRARRTTKKAAATVQQAEPAEPAEQAAPEVAQAPAAGDEPAAEKPKRTRTTKKTAARKAAAPAQEAPVEAAPVEEASVEAAPVEAAPVEAAAAHEDAAAAVPAPEAAPEQAPAAPLAPPAVLFQPPAPTTTRPRRRAASRPAGPPVHVEPPVVETVTAAGADEQETESELSAPEQAALDAAATELAEAAQALAQETAAEDHGADGERAEDEGAEDESAEDESAEDREDTEDREEGEGGERRRRRRRGGRGRRGRRGGDDRDDSGDEAAAATVELQPEAEAEVEISEAEGEPAAGSEDADGEDDGRGTRRRRRRRRRGGGGGEGEEAEGGDDPERTVVHVREPRRRERGDRGDRADRSDEVAIPKGSTRLEAKKQRRREGREQGRRRTPIVSEAEFLARREAVERVMVIRQSGDRTQIGVLEDGVLVEHYVNREQSVSMAGNVYLGKVQNVLPSMEAAFVDIGKGRNAVLYAGEVNWDAAGLEGQPKRIEAALKSGDAVLVQVTKDPIGHKGARLTSQVSLPGRYLVYVPNGSMTGISRKLPDTERSRLKAILKKVVPDDAGVIIRTAAEGASEEEIARDVARLQAQWEDISRKAKAANPPSLLYGEPDLTTRVVRDVFNEDFSKLVVSGDEAWATVQPYVEHVAPDLAERLERWDGDRDVFAAHRIDEQLAKALDRKVWLPSGGYLIIDNTEAMTVVDVNTGKFTGKGGNLEETVTKNNIEAAEEIVRQLRLRDVGGMIVIDFIDMVLESNRELVLRRLIECLGRDRTKHQVAEVTSLGLVQMTRKRVGQGLLDAFSHTCEHCHGRGVVVQMEPVESGSGGANGGGGNGPAKVRHVKPIPMPPPKPRETTPAGEGAAEDAAGEAADADELEVAAVEAALEPAESAERKPARRRRATRPRTSTA
ncbi:MAG TPA: Rne/Rng family ribonuclease [Motilibacteraceae bacterium]|nr:Rne/Rng family ribonuclease [Motilibacteraceae bacterium]